MRTHAIKQLKYTTLLFFSQHVEGKDFVQMTFLLICKVSAEEQAVDSRFWRLSMYAAYSII